MSSFPLSDLAKGTQCLELNCDCPLQSSLGFGWDLNSDSFVFKIDVYDDCPQTKRGVLLTVNMVFDPLGFLAPFTLVERLFLRDIVLEQKDWYDKISVDVLPRWLEWRESLPRLHSLQGVIFFIR